MLMEGGKIRRVGYLRGSLDVDVDSSLFHSTSRAAQLLNVPTWE